MKEIISASDEGKLMLVEAMLGEEGVPDTGDDIADDCDLVG